MLDYDKIKAQTEQRVDRNVKVSGNLTSQQVHKYASEVLGINHLGFTQVVGKYNPDDIDITGITMGRQEILFIIHAKVKERNVAGSPFTRLVQKSGEISVTPTEYIVTSKVGTVSTVRMVHGIPASEPAAMILAHQSVTTLLGTSAPEYNKIIENNKEKREMSHPVTCDSAGIFYPPVCVADMLDLVKKHYKGAAGIIDVRSKVLAEASGNGSLMQVSSLSLFAHNYTVQAVRKAKKWKPSWDAVDCIVPVDNERNVAVYKSAKVDPIMVRQNGKVPTVTLSTLIDGYEFLQQNRGVRGPDEAKISPLTNAYAYGDVDGYYRGINSSADIMQVMDYLGCNSVRFCVHSTYKSAWTVLQFNVVIFKEGVAGKTFEDQKYGVFRVPQVVPVDMLVIDCVSTSPPRKAKSGEWEFEPDIAKSKENIEFHLKAYPRGAIKVYAYPGIWEEFPNRIHPSLHAHSGVVWVTNRADSPYTEKEHIKRWSRANMLKTYYPFLFRKMSIGDVVSWPTVCVKRMNQRKVPTGFEVMYVDDAIVETEPVLTEEQINTLDAEQRALVNKNVEAQLAQPTVLKYEVQRVKIQEMIDANALAMALEASKTEGDSATSMDAHFDGLDLDYNEYVAEEDEDPVKHEDEEENNSGAENDPDADEEHEEKDDAQSNDGDSVHSGSNED